MNESIVVLDFETTGLSPSSSRVIEVAALKVDNGFVTDSFVQLMHPGHPIPSYITGLTGITSAMVDGMRRDGGAIGHGTVLFGERLPFPTEL